MPARSRLRIEESACEARAFRAEVTKWRAAWNKIDELGAHHTQLDLLADVVLNLTGAIAAQTKGINPDLPDGDVYDQCRTQDRKLLHARRLWQWYADKFDQRVNLDGPTIQTLQGADEIIWSCWKTAFAAFGEAVPAAPVAYLAAEFSASATPRTDVPAGLRPGTDDLLRQHIERLPLPVIGLPPVCVQRPWWLIIAAHETAHHVQFEIGGLEKQTQDAVTAAVGEITGDSLLAGRWLPWCRELFADACSVLLTGPASTWAVRELETRAAASMRMSPAKTYPPPAVRLAFLNAVAERAGLPPLTSAEPDSADDGDALRQHLGCVPAVADALLSLAPAAGRAPLRVLGSGAAEAWAAAPYGVAGWQTELLGTDPPLPRDALDAARLCAAGGVAAWQHLADADTAGESWQALASRLRAALVKCHEPGTRAAGPAPDAAGIADQFLTDLDAEDTPA